MHEVTSAEFELDIRRLIGCARRCIITDNEFVESVTQCAKQFIEQLNKDEPTRKDLGV